MKTYHSILFITLLLCAVAAGNTRNEAAGVPQSATPGKESNVLIDMQERPLPPIEAPGHGFGRGGGMRMGRGMEAHGTGRGPGMGSPGMRPGRGMGGPGMGSPGMGAPGMGHGPQFKHRVMEIIQSPERMAELRRRNPQLADKVESAHRLHFQIRRLLENYHSAEARTQKQRFEEQLRPLLAQEYELELERQRLEIKYMEERIRQLKEILKKREENKDRLIERHIRFRLSNPLMRELEDSSPEAEPVEEHPLPEPEPPKEN
ncbi:MAG: hypothetical protein ACOX5R_20890 [bacterium]|jgi:hypothetical protein